MRGFVDSLRISGPQSPTVPPAPTPDLLRLVHVFREAFLTPVAPSGALEGRFSQASLGTVRDPTSRVAWVCPCLPLRGVYEEPGGRPHGGCSGDAHELSTWAGVWNTPGRSVQSHGPFWGPLSACSLT